jgi:peptidoglycan/xylan/chitin deacetylase (PgdA/CDA1 family)
MLRNRIYYGIKPLVPFSVRHRLRGWLARRQREQSAEVWPILPGSENPPRNWPGWPDGKKFAFVLTHDVEGQSGLGKVPRLMELERRLGFRSSFNFVPEGEYQTPRELRAQLVADGFEVGVHDLHHDGKLFLNEREFHRNADRINRYLRDWGASGFRSGFMLHNLDWIHALNLQYDASTFDTDPFEPQPQGQHTIFPFWVPHPESGKRKAESGNQKADHGPKTSDLGPRTSPLASDRTGYVELPYTLPQDSTLFVLLGERHPDIWFQKLDWIARHGGMALVNVHPDYTRFAHESPSARTFPVELYTRFLGYARQRYGDSFWQPLPQEVARFVTTLRCPILTSPAVSATK